MPPRLGVSSSPESSDPESAPSADSSPESATPETGRRRLSMSLFPPTLVVGRAAPDAAPCAGTGCVAESPVVMTFLKSSRSASKLGYLSAGSSASIFMTSASICGERPLLTSLGLRGAPSKRFLTTAAASSPSNGATPVSAW